MTYSDIINNKMILDYKNKYTKNDYIKLVNNGVTPKTARFICICSAIFHNVEYSNYFHSRKLLLECGMLY